MRRLVLLLLTFTLTASAQPYDPSLFAEMRWRMIGPFRGGRTVAAAGIPSQPNVFYIGVNNGGVWKTTDAGRIWLPIFDEQPTGSIGAIAIAPSNPNVIYVGSGEGLQRPDLSTGDGIYKSTDAGKSWTHLGLRDGQQIPMIAVDPRDPNRLYVAVLGHPYGPNEERGIFPGRAGRRSAPISHGKNGAFPQTSASTRTRPPRSQRSAAWSTRWLLPRSMFAGSGQEPTTG